MSDDRPRVERATLSEATFGRRSVVGVVRGPQRAARALFALGDAGIAPDHVSMTAERERDVRGRGDVGVAAIVGGTWGAFAGWLVGSLALPADGSLATTGTLAMTIGGAIGGALVGGFARPLLARPRGELIVLRVETADDRGTQRAYEVLRQHGPTDVRFAALRAVGGCAADQPDPYCAIPQMR